jgi:uridine phosphorylase
MKQQPYPILEFDPSPEAILEPSRILSPINIPEHCVLCFFQDVITTLVEAGQARQIHRLGSEIGHNPVYEMLVDGRRLALVHPGVGAPLSAAFLDELIALGSRQFVACGGCGVLDGSIGVGHVVVPVSAVRDEGTSYHYLPPGREVTAAPAAVAAIEATLQRHQVGYVKGKTWTTDAVYRETAAKVQLRRAEGCLTVEMETAAFFAVAQFRGVTLGQILYGGDDLTGDVWDHRDWQQQLSTREKLFWLAAEACLALGTGG